MAKQNSKVQASWNEKLDKIATANQERLAWDEEYRKTVPAWLVERALGELEERKRCDNEPISDRVARGMPKPLQVKFGEDPTPIKQNEEGEDDGKTRKKVDLRSVTSKKVQKTMGDEEDQRQEVQAQEDFQGDQEGQRLSKAARRSNRKAQL